MDFDTIGAYFFLGGGKWGQPGNVFGRLFSMAEFGWFENFLFFDLVIRAILLLV